MHYSYEYKRKCVELYREGRWPETPDGITDYIDYYNNEQVILQKEGVNNKLNKTCAMTHYGAKKHTLSSS